MTPDPTRERLVSFRRLRADVIRVVFDQPWCYVPNNPCADAVRGSAPGLLGHLATCTFDDASALLGHGGDGRGVYERIDGNVAVPPSRRGRAPCAPMMKRCAARASTGTPAAGSEA